MNSLPVPTLNTNLFKNPAFVKYLEMKGGQFPTIQLADFDLEATQTDEHQLEINDALTALQERHAEVAELRPTPKHG